MQFNSIYQLLSVLLIIGGLSFGCERDLEDLEPAEFPTNGDVFIDGFTGGMEYAAFGGSKVTAFDVDTEIKYEGTTSMRFAVPDFEDPEGAYAGGTFFLTSGRNLSGYTALTFWARATRSATIDEIGFGNDLGENRYVTSVAGGIQVNTNWQKYYIPIPDPSKLTSERGMLFYAEGPEDGEGYTFWIDQVQFEDLGTIAGPEGFIFNGEDRVVTSEGGSSFNADGYTVFNLPTGIDQRINTAPAYFNYVSSNPEVATVSESGIVSVIGGGEAVITATIGDEAAKGSLTITSTGQATTPQQAAPTPTYEADDVISIYSNAYEDEPVDFYNGFWEFSTTLNDFTEVQGNDVIRYFDLNFVGIQFTSPTIDVSEMTHFRIDIWTPSETAPPADFKVLLVDLGSDNAFGGNDDSSHELTFTSPTLVSEQWVTLEIPLSDFTGLTGQENLAQIVLSGSPSIVFVDNMLFYAGENDPGPGDDAPTVAAPTPSVPAANVISLFSDAYTDVGVDTWRTEWSMADFTDVEVAGNPTKRYSNLEFVGVETTGANLIDATDMTHIRLDVWTPDATTFRIKIVDFGADGEFDGGDDTEHEIIFEAPSQNQWITYDIPLSDFTGLTNQDNLAQFIFSAVPVGATTVWIDNVFLRN
ncbi:hypothetical protein CEQ90_03800 [Lewinellaceae bacterium SD302]|nr:hypothetical protein CEQ90_03800 [Lewinellaceae bacterium SD302]